MVGAVLVAVLLSGCVSTVDGTAVAGRSAGPREVAPLRESQLDGVLLTIGELNAVMGSTRVEITGDYDDMSDLSAEVSDPDCLGAVYGAEETVYAGSGWTAVRDQVAREPDYDNDHWVEQSAVLYPAAENARRFVDESADMWRDCAGSAIVVSDALWELGDVEVRDGVVTQLTIQEGAGGWGCEHALSAVSNVTVEAWACSYSVTDEAAQIARAMADNAAK